MFMAFSATIFGKNAREANTYDGALHLTSSSLRLKTAKNGKEADVYIFRNIVVRKTDVATISY